MNANINQFQNPSVKAKRGGRRGALKARLLQWPIKDMALTDFKVGTNTITLSPGGSDVVRWSGSQAPTALGDIGMNTSTGRASVFVSGAAELLCLEDEAVLIDGSNAMTGDLNMGANQVSSMGEPVASDDGATKNYVDTRIAAQVNGGGAAAGFVGFGLITEINALSPVAGDVVVAKDAGTPSAGTSSLLAIGDVAEYDGTSWILIIANSGGFPPSGTRILVATTTGFIDSPNNGVTTSTDEGKIAVWDGAALAPASFTTPSDGVLVGVACANCVNDAKSFIFDGTVPTGAWAQAGGVGSAHSALTGLTTGDDHTQYLLLIGRSGGQQVSGGTASGDDLTLQSTTNATKGDIIFASGTNLQMAGNDDFVPASANTGEIGTNALPFLRMRAQEVVSGDHVFMDDQNGWAYRIKESSTGLSMYNEHTGEYMGELVTRKSLRRRLANAIGL